MTRVSANIFIANSVKGGHGHRLFYRIYEPTDKKILATILIIHGMQEHSGRYEELAEHLTTRGYVVLTYDQLGHGKTAKNDKELGYIPSSHPTDQLIQDAITIGESLRQRYPNLPHFILGHSMGSFVARCVLQEVGDTFKGAILVGTGQRQKGTSIFQILLACLNTIAPGKRSKFINRIFNSRNNARFKNEPNQQNTNWLSINKANRLAFIEDPLCGGLFTNNGFFTALGLNLRATNPNRTKRIPQTLPILFISGQDDPIGDLGAGVKQASEQLRQQGQIDISIKLYAGMRHEILNEDCKKEVFEFITIWLDKHLS
ncbi:lysophospholipase [Sphingobacterium sp. N143]|uniref:alpha/beta hydrolase n=1 Tax=Sphingobacterium sp. N143 TaxID=2746727 RepID=UPI002578BAD5|nr:alpha/beta hydrolase [Sphingobacterium sp. N143]MDM1292761.1 lysophospholipase [Sphingobacterium sp. N143]